VPVPVGTLEGVQILEVLFDGFDDPVGGLVGEMGVGAQILKAHAEVGGKGGNAVQGERRQRFGFDDQGGVGPPIGEERHFPGPREQKNEEGHGHQQAGHPREPRQDGIATDRDHERPAL
jgi:hypothetical protein